MWPGAPGWTTGQSSPWATSALPTVSRIELKQNYFIWDYVCLLTDFFFFFELSNKYTPNPSQVAPALQSDWEGTVQMMFTGIMNSPKKGQLEGVLRSRSPFLKELGVWKQAVLSVSRPLPPDLDLSVHLTEIQKAVFQKWLVCFQVGHPQQTCCSGLSRNHTPEDKSFPALILPTHL